jgi:hypothetical protein
MESTSIELTIAAVNETYGVNLSLKPSTVEQPFNNKLLSDNETIVVGSLGAIQQAVLNIAKGIEIGRNIH